MTADASPKILTVRMMDAAEDGIPVEIQFRASVVVKKIPNGHGLSRLNIILNNDEIAGTELVTEKI